MRVINPRKDNPITIEFSAVEARKLKSIIGRINGVGELREFSSTLFSLLQDYDFNVYSKFIKESMVVKSKE